MNNLYLYNLQHNKAVTLINDYFNTFSDITDFKAIPLDMGYEVSRNLIHNGKIYNIISYISQQKFISLLRKTLEFKGYNVIKIHPIVRGNNIIYQVHINLVDNVKLKRKL